MTDPISKMWESQRSAMGAFIRSQRELANMSLRELSKATQVSNAYLSQVERGLHDPTLRVLVQIGDALHLSVEEMLRQQILPDDKDADDDESGEDKVSVEAAIALDPVLNDAEKEALRSVYRSYLRAAAERALAERADAQDSADDGGQDGGAPEAEQAGDAALGGSDESEHAGDAGETGPDQAAARPRRRRAAKSAD